MHDNLFTHEIVNVRPPPDPVEARRLCTSYFDAIALDYDAQDLAHEKRRLYQESVDDYVTQILNQTGPEQIILSFGCGTGRREWQIVKRLVDPCSAIYGVESSARMASQARERGLRILEDLATQVTLESESVDTVLSLSSFVHLPDALSRRTALSEFYRLLRPKGALMLDVFNLHDQFEWGPELIRNSSVHDPFEQSGDVYYKRLDRPEVSYMHYFSIGEITSLIEGSGFVIVDLVGVGYATKPGQRPVALNAGCLLLHAIKVR